MSLLGELRFDDRKAASSFKFKERRLPIGGLNFRIAFEGEVEGKHDDNKHGSD